MKAAPPARPTRSRKKTTTVPTPTEIRRRARAIRSNWSDAELTQRSVKTRSNGKKYRIDGAEPGRDAILLAHINFVRLLLEAGAV